MPVIIAQRTESEPFYVDITIEKDRVLHNGFQDQTTAQIWANKIARRMQNYQKHLTNICGIPHAFSMPERSFSEDA